MYVYCGNDPIAQGSVIPAEDVSSGEDGKQVKYLDFFQILIWYPGHYQSSSSFEQHDR